MRSYRIDANVHTDHGVVAISWDVPVLTHDTSTESPVLAADRDWSEVPTDHWTVLAPGYGTRVTPIPSEQPLADPTDACLGGTPAAPTLWPHVANLGISPWYVGIAHPGDGFDSVTVRDLAVPPRGARWPFR